MTLKINRPTQAIIRLDHLEHNFHYLGKLAGEVSTAFFYCPMVKANAYGHGDVAVALKLQEIGAHHLGVGLIEEGVLLRQNGVQIPLIFFGKFTVSDLPDIFNYKLTPVMSDWQQLRETADWVCDHIKDFHANPFNIHIKFDTGMHRLGFPLDQASEVSEFLKQNSQLWLEGVLTHLHSAEDLRATLTRQVGTNDVHATALTSAASTSMQQLLKFQQIQKYFTRWTPFYHSLNSAGILNFYSQTDFFQQQGLSLQGIRPGLALYGVDPFHQANSSLKPVMSLVSRVVHFVKVPKGETVSYGGTWTAARDSWIGVIPMGYADGYHRLLSNKSQVLIHGKKFPQVGQVCMDYFMVDLTESATTESERQQLLAAEVVLLGQSLQQEITAWDLAKHANTIAWEVLTSIGERVPRKVV